MKNFIEKKVRVKNENKMDVCVGIFTGIENGMFVGVEFETKVYNDNSGKMENEKKKIFYPANGSFCFEFVVD